MLSFALAQMRLEFREVNTGPQALTEMTEMEVGIQPPVVVLDVDLPGMDGHAILERVGALRPDTFLIVVLSSHADESVQVRSLLAGAVDHMPKPFNVRILMAKIHRWVAMSARLAATV
jgi:DNA-binding response OmpR family regulator